MRINLWGGPGAGKSTVAHRLFSELKMADYPVEFVPEYVKTWAYDGRHAKSYNQIYIFGKQLYAEYRLLDIGVSNLICECPVLMNVAYCSIQHCNCMYELLEIALKFESDYPSCNIFLDRSDKPYQQWGRYQSYEQALEVDQQLLAFLHNTQTSFVTIPALDFDRILQKAISALSATP